jgi:hypothetical protein
MKTYNHTQQGRGIVVGMAAGAALVLLAGLFLRPVLFAIPILALSGWLFHSLTIEISEGKLCWRFGPGWIRKQVPLDMIVSAEPVRTNVLEGWGIHLSRFGWLYNVSGFDAVAVRMKNGKHFALGTDEPTVLAAQLAQHKLPLV